MERTDKLIKQRYPSLTGRQVEDALALLNLKKGQKREALPDTAALDRHLEKLRAGNPSLEIPILAEGDGYVVVDKPAGVPSHPLGLLDESTVTAWALAKFPAARAEFPQVQPTLVPHRLDTDTTGLLIVALTVSAFDEWRALFSKKKVRKKYLAWCRGKPKEDVFEVNYAIAHSPDPKRMAIPAKGDKHVPPVQEAQSLVKVLKRTKEGWLAEVECFSGVTHQVRVHLASMGFPLVGDAIYGEGPGPHWLRAVELETGARTYRAPIDTYLNAFNSARV